MATVELPTIPETITVHLGEPDSPAANITVPFIDYIKNVASSEIYPTWPEAAIRANILAQITFALNRIYTEHYRSKGYDFDITNSTKFDQYYVLGRDVFQNVSQIVDEIFNNYVVKGNGVEPFFTQFCNGTTVTCPGLSQWGTVDLANLGYTPEQIIKYYYGDESSIIENAPIEQPLESFPGILLTLGIVGNDVETIQVQLARIAQNFPSIPKITDAKGVYGKSTENAVKQFQRIFNLTADGIVGKATWYKLRSVYNAVKELSELSSEGLTYEELARQFPGEIKMGDTGIPVNTIQYFLAVLGYFDPNLPDIRITGNFDAVTENAVKQFQDRFGLPVTGIVEDSTWNKIRSVYTDLLRTLPATYSGEFARLYPGYFLVEGTQGDDVKNLQTYLNFIATYYPNIPKVTVDGIFGPATRAQVFAFQTEFGLPATGSVGPIVWNRMAQIYDQLVRSGLKP